MTERLQLLKSTSTIAAFTFLSRIFGYVRDNRIAFLLGAGVSADAFSAAFTIPNLLRRLVGEGVVSAVFIPAFSRYLAADRRDEAWKFANAVLTLLTALLAAVTALGILLSPLIVRVVAYGFTGTPERLELTVLLNRIIFPYVFLIGLAALAMGVLHSFHRFAAAAFAPVLLNVSIITFSFFSGMFPQPAMALAVGVVVGGALQVAIQIPSLRKLGWRPAWSWRPSHDGVRQLVRLLVPVTLGTGVTQINVAVAFAFASFLPEGSVASIRFADRVMELALGGFVTAVAVATLPALSHQAAGRRFDDMQRTLEFSARLALFVTVPAAIGLVVLRREIVEVLFQYGTFDAESTALTAWALPFFAVGLPAFALVRLMAPAFYALQDLRTPVRIACAAMLLNIALNVALIGPLGNGGPPLAASLAALFNAAALMAMFARAHGGMRGYRTVFAALLRFAGAGAVMAVAVRAIVQWPGFYAPEIAPRSVALAVTIAAGAVVYCGAAFLLGARELMALRRWAGGGKPGTGSMESES